ncbi:MAG: sulfite exporter TauE/SafE family protein, partial [Eudoraea sp.]|nr:sulfite exporter TauE/SafE family protein [Eudoraea sp.]
RKFIIPAIPENLFSIGDFVVTRDVGVMVFFAILMLAASYTMIKSKQNGEEERTKEKSFNYPLIVLEGMAVGLATGIVGAGGGFLIIPALVLLAGLPMKKAVATSLLIIAIKSLIGFVGDVENLPIDWPFLLSFTATSVVGIFLGIWLTHYISGTQLKKGFGWFVLVMAVVILIQELALS